MTHAYYEEWQIVFYSDAKDKLSFDDFFLIIDLFLRRQICIKTRWLSFVLSLLDWFSFDCCK